MVFRHGEEQAAQHTHVSDSQRPDAILVKSVCGLPFTVILLILATARSCVTHIIPLSEQALFSAVRHAFANFTVVWVLHCMHCCRKFCSTRSGTCKPKAQHAEISWHHVLNLGTAMQDTASSSVSPTDIFSDD
jgi:hypothetical protein